GDGERVALANADVVVLSPSLERTDRAFVVHDAKAQRVAAQEDTLLLAYLIEPSRPQYPVDELAAEYGLELRPDPAAEEETEALVRRAAATARLAEPLLARVREREMETLYREI